jgi:hypothetical protein
LDAGMVSAHPHDLGARLTLAEPVTDVATLVRLCAGRGPDPARYHLFR